MAAALAVDTNGVKYAAVLHGVPRIVEALLQGVPELGKLCCGHPLVRKDVNARLGGPGCELGGHGFSL